MDHEQEIKRELVHLLYWNEFAKLSILVAQNKLRDFKIEVDTCNYSIGADGVLEYDVVIKRTDYSVRLC